ncbi:LYSINE-SPECIFIC HISTONE DEMETHYLASE 1-like protein 3 [Salix viminalis]|nr:LYSINE-SPECIFIC HISTONE DEMETHYLASE 1-like protein 3 [Salix viminalis]KAJ6736351.1 LYSINE-SPECIFIC HISTONE DEMETHYLASE 1-like protein 3 [Salix viminalis]
MERDDLSNCKDLEIKLRPQKVLPKNLLKLRVNKGMEEQKKLLGKLIEDGIDSDDNEPIGSLFKLKRPRNPKKVKVVLENIEVKEDKLVVEGEDLGGMDDTLASFKKKLKTPKKGLGSVSASQNEGEELLDGNVEKKLQNKSKERARKAGSVCKRVRIGGDIAADDDSEGLGSQGANLLENQEKEILLPGESSGQPLDKLEDSISGFYQKNQLGSVWKSSANLSSNQINRVQCLEARLSPGFGVGSGGSKDVALSTVGSGPVSSVFCNDLEAGDSSHIVVNSCLLDSTSRQILTAKNLRLDNGFGETSYCIEEHSDRFKGLPVIKDESMNSNDKRHGETSYCIEEHSDRFKGLPVIKDESMNSNDKRHGKSSEVTAVVAAPVSPASGSQHGVIEDEEKQDPCISNVKGESTGKPCSSYRIWNESQSTLGNNDSLESQTLKNGLKLCSVGKVSTRDALEQQSKDVSAACISNAEPQISLSSGGREVSASSSPNSQNDLQDLASVPKKENVKMSDGRFSPITVTSREVHKSTLALHMNHNGNSDYLSINEEANEPSPRSVTPEENESYPEDAVSVPDSDIKDGNLAAVQRAMRKPKRRRFGDMAYEGDADWEILINEQQFLENDQVVESDRSLRTREKSDSSSNSAEAENGGITAISAGLKARAAGPVEKIKFKEILKRKGGLQEYLECRNRILGLWSKDISRILALADCGIAETPSQDESPHASLIRQIYVFLDQSGYINAGIASEKESAEPSANHNYKLVKEKTFEGNSGASVADLEDGVSFILGNVKSSENSLELKDRVPMDNQDMSLKALKSGKLVTPMTLDLPNVMECEEWPAEDIMQNSASNTKLSDGLASLDALTNDPSCTFLDSRTVPAINLELRNGLQSVKSNSCVDMGGSHKLLCDSKDRKKIIVIGAGPAGLTAARHLQRQGFSVTILEARSRIGGRVYTDRSSLSVPVDLGASIITGVEADVTTERRPDPSSLICAQLGLELTVLNSDCPLYDIVTGEKVPTDLDEELEAEYNSLLDDMILVIAQKGQHAMKMSLEDGLNYALKTHRMAYPGAYINETESGNAVDALYDSKTCSVDGGAPENSKEEILSPLERRVMDWHFAHLEYGCAASLKEVSLPYWNQDDVYGGFGGAHCMIKGGYSNVVESLGEGLPIHLNHVVTNISYGIKDAGASECHHSKVKIHTSNGSEFLGDAVLITVPLGCLKAETIKFSPPLPQWKCSSIQRLGFGVLNKVVLEFPDVFWDDSVDYFGATAEETDRRGHCFMFWNVKKTAGAPVLIALVVGKAAIDGQRMSSSDHVSHALIVLRKLFGEALVPDPVASVVTDWGRDPFSYGAYSYVAIGSSGEDYDILGKPVENCVFFAGEATCKEHPDTVGGAMMSGLREAVRIIDILNMGTDFTSEVEAMEGAQRHSEVERDEVRDITKRLEAIELSNVLYKNSLDRARLLTREDLLQDMFFSAKTIAGRLHLAKKLLNLPVGTLKSFAGTRKGLTMLNSWILDSMGKDGTQLLRHCVRLLVLVSTDLLAVRLSGIGKTVKEKVCVHTSRDIRAIASQLVSVWLGVFRREKASNGGVKLSRHATALESSKRKSLNNSTSGKPPLRTHHGALLNRGNLQVSTSTRGPLPSNSNMKKANSKPETLKCSSGPGIELEGGITIGISEEEQAALAAEEAARAAAHVAAQAYASSESKFSTLVQLPKIPSFHKFARREQYAQMDEYDLRRKWSGGVLGKQDCISETDSRNCRVRDWSVDFSSACANFDSSRMSGDNLSQRSHSNEIASHMSFREQSGESAAVDSSLFTKAWVDTAGSAGIKGYHAIERWQCQAAAADSDFFHQAMHIKEEEDSNTSSKPPTWKHDGRAKESSISQVTVNKEPSRHHSQGADRIKQAVVDFVSSLLMPVYKARKIDKEGYKSIMKKISTKVMEKATDAEKAMAVSEFLDFKRKNKIRAFVDKLIENHMAMKPAVEP